ncbi:hypothetical protein PVL29_009121 [Vitis rotundifolia]|uniref:Auxin-responsive protein n=1 Tax=Vitis rotundifolia TaxID=103349 RepID=A0AA38ZZL3_VITRO|nr:hypothetical protein PVL29_009121 [Vitis rotundifolia]
MAALILSRFHSFYSGREALGLCCKRACKCPCYKGTGGRMATSLIFPKEHTMASSAKDNEDAERKSGLGRLYVKVSMDGASYKRKVDLKIYCNYMELSLAMEKMFSCFTIG